MSYEIVNKLHGRSAIRATGDGTYNFELSDFSSNTALENVQSASISGVMWATAESAGPAAFIEVKRNNVVMINLFGSGDWTSNDGSLFPLIGANNKTANLTIQIHNYGTIILGITKESLYNVADLYQTK